MSKEFRGKGANGGCYFEIEEMFEGHPFVSVGWSCVRVHNGPMPVTWLAELIAIASDHPQGVSGFLQEQRYGGESYALMCDPPQCPRKEN